MLFYPLWNGNQPTMPNNFLQLDGSEVKRPEGFVRREREGGLKALNPIQRGFQKRYFVAKITINLSHLEQFIDF